MIYVQSHLKRKRNGEIRYIFVKEVIRHHIKNATMVITTTTKIICIYGTYV